MEELKDSSKTRAEIPDYLRDQLLNPEDKEAVAKMHYSWYGYSLKRLMVQMGKSLLPKLDPRNSTNLLNCLSKIEKSSKEELEKTAKCLFLGKLKSLRLEKLKYKKPSVKKVKKTKILKYRRSKRSYRLIDRRHSVIKNSKSYSLHDAKSSPISNLSNLFLTLLGNTTTPETQTKWKSTFDRMTKLNKNMEQSRTSTLRTYKKRVYDLILDENETREQDFEIPFQNSHPLLQDGIRLVNSISNSGLSDKLSARILSPRFAPLTSTRSKSKGLFSPSIFPFYKDDVEDQILPIPDIMDKTGMHKKDKDKLMALIMELSRTRSIVEESMKMVTMLNGGNKESGPYSDAVFAATDKMSKDLEELDKSLTVDQNVDLKNFGFSMLEIPQMEKLFGKYGADEVLRKSEMMEYRNYTKEQRMLSLWKSIERIAFGEPTNQPIRRKRQGFRLATESGFTIISVLQPTILSPYVFSPVYGFSVLGPVILSPNVFSPLILNPSLLSPWIFSPAVPLPFILSPYLLSPYIFSPLVMAPFILNPYVLSPNVFNPYVLSPLVLSPLVLCPDVFSPMTLGGAILSPSVLSPQPFTKYYIMAAILSPSVLS